MATRAAGICRHIGALPGNRYLTDRAKDHCYPIALAFVERGGDFGAVLHAVYVVACESSFDVDANRRNWGSIGRVPVGWWAHMSHLWPGRSLRLLGYLIDPLDLYQSSVLAAALVFDDGQGFRPWWHCHWSLNPWLARHGIAGVYIDQPDAYWRNVRGGHQVAPWDR